MQLTVAMCTYNPSRETLLRALDAIVAQLDDVVSVEILVIDNNSNPPLAGHDYLAPYPIRLIRESRAGLTAAREAAIKNAEGDVIVFVDDDNILDEHYLTTVVETFSADPHLGLLGGRIGPEYEVTPPNWFSEFEPWLAVRAYAPDARIETVELPESAPFTRYFPVGAGFAVRRDLALAHQEDCARTQSIEGRRGSTLSSGEDLDLGLFVLSRGEKLVVSGALGLTHVIPVARLRVQYLQRLATGSVKSSRELEKKWAPRFGRTVYPMHSMPTGRLITRAAVSAVLGMRSPRYRIKRCVYVELLRTRFSG